MHFISNSKDEVKKTTFALYIRSRKEIIQPFVSAESPVRRAGFSLLSCDFLSYYRHQCTGDVNIDAKQLVDGMRVWSNHTILSGNNYFPDCWGCKKKLVVTIRKLSTVMLNRSSKCNFPKQIFPKRRGLQSRGLVRSEISWLQLKQD